jgi:hypothetical protein
VRRSTEAFYSIALPARPDRPQQGASEGSQKKLPLRRFKDDTANAVRAKGGSYHA